VTFDTDDKPIKLLIVHNKAKMSGVGEYGLLATHKVQYTADVLLVTHITNNTTKAEGQYTTFVGSDDITI